MIIFVMLLLMIFNPISLLISIYGVIKTPKQWRRFYPILIVSIGMLAYHLPEIFNGDLSRYFVYLDSFSEMTFSQSVQYLNDKLYVENLLFWIVAKSSDYHVLPAITTATVYAVMIYITCDSAEVFGKEKYIPITLAVQLSCLPFGLIVENVRNISSFAVVILAIYLDIFKRKKDIWILILYVLPCFMHSSAIILLLIRITIKLTNKFKTVFLAGMMGIPFIIDILYEHNEIWEKSGILKNIFFTVIKSAYVYLHSSSEWTLIVQESTLQNVLKIIVSLLAFLMLVYLYGNGVKYIAQKGINAEYQTLICILCVIVLLCNVFPGTVYWRFSATCILHRG